MFQRHREQSATLVNRRVFPPCYSRTRPERPGVNIAGKYLVNLTLRLDRTMRQLALGLPALYRRIPRRCDAPFSGRYL